MPTQKEIIYNIKNISSGGIQGNDDWKKLSNRQLEFITNYARAILIRRDIDKKRTINPDIVQDLGCVEMELVDSAECEDIETECLVLRTVKKIPKLIEVADRNLLQYVGLVDKTKAFQQIPIARQRWMRFNPYTSKMSVSYYLNGYVYITNDAAIDFINIRGVFEDPREVSNYSSNNGVPCYSTDSEYPIAMWMIQPLTQMILSGEAGSAKAIPLDETNDNNPSNVTITK